MRANDINNREEVRARMQQALRNNDSQGFYDAFDQMLGCIEQDIRQDYDAHVESLRQDMDGRVLAARGIRQLTSKEREYYQALGKAMQANDPKQALANIGVTMPKTVVDAVFDELQTAHPLLSRINFMPTGGAIKLLVNQNGYQEATWGELCDKIVKELTSGFVAVDTGLYKLSAFLPVCKAMLELGPEWLDNYVRQVLYEALSNGMEAGIVTGDGNKKPIGMNRQVGEGVSVTGGVYPEKAKVKIKDLRPETIGNLLSLMAVDANGKSRQVRDLLLIVNPQDYFQRVMPATTVMAPDGTYRNDILPYPMTVIQSAALEPGAAILGMGYRYFAAAGTSPEGRIEYSDHYQFLEDNRVYLIKAYANGMPLDNNAFVYLDISGLTPAAYRVEQVTRTPSDDATLADIKIGSLALTPNFDSATMEYTATTTNATNTVKATPADAGAKIKVSVNNIVIDNGSAATWNSGSNTVKVGVTAADGTTTELYTVTVTKS